MSRKKRLFRERQSWRRAITVWVAVSAIGWIGIGGLWTAFADTAVPAAAAADQERDVALARAMGTVLARD